MTKTLIRHATNTDFEFLLEIDEASFPGGVAYDAVELAYFMNREGAETIVVEVVDPACATTSALLTTLSNARGQYQALGPLVGRQMRVRGVGFYDFAHGQTGRSESCLELHPVLSINPQ